MARTASAVSPLTAILLLIAAIAIPMGLLLAISGTGEFRGLGWSPEVVIGLVIVFAVAMIILLLTFMAVIFRVLGAVDPTKPLALPEGSVRALIAIFFLMMFVIVGIFLFTSVSGIFRSRGEVQEVTLEKVLELRDEITSVRRLKSGNYAIMLRGPSLTEEGARMAQQLVTILSTLVGTIAGFYFGTSTLRAAREALAPPLKVTNVTPAEASTSKVEVVVAGAGFSEDDYVTLRKAGTPDIDALDVQFQSSSRLKCAFDLTGAGIGRYDVVVVASDGREGRKESAFNITGPVTPLVPVPSSSATPEPPPHAQQPAPPPS